MEAVQAALARVAVMESTVFSAMQGRLDRPGIVTHFVDAGQIDSTNMNIDIRKIDSDNIHTITGRIIPSFSWKETEFLENGCGYIAFDHERYCGTAFSAAVSSEEIDVGVEVDPDYRGRGIATALVQKMCVEVISQGKKPVWAHAATNAGSLHTALRCGFIRKKENSMIRLKQAE